VQPNPRHRATRESKRYRREADAIKPDTKRLDQILEGTIWAIERAAEWVGRPTAAPSIRAIPTRSWGDTPALVIYYSYDDEYADLLSIRYADEGDAEEESDPEEEDQT